MKKGLKITFINSNTEEQIVQVMAGSIAYNLADNDEKIKFDYSNSNTYQNSHEEMEDEEYFKMLNLAYRQDKNNLKNIFQLY